MAVIANLILAFTPAKARDAGSALLPQDAKTAAATSRIAQAFPGTGTNAIAYLVLEGRDQLGPADQQYFDAAVSALRADTAHVGSVLDWWSDPLTAPLGTSPDGRSGFAMVWLRGEAGTAQARESLDAARSVVRKLPPSAGLRARITVPATTNGMPLHMTAWQGAAIVTAAAVIAVLLLLRARQSTIAVGIALLTAGLSLAVAWPLAAVVRGLHGGNVSVFTVFLCDPGRSPDDRHDHRIHHAGCAAQARRNRFGHGPARIPRHPARVSPARCVHRDAHRPAAACPNPGAAQRRHRSTGCRCGTCGFVDAIACPDRARGATRGA